MLSTLLLFVSLFLSSAHAGVVPSSSDHSLSVRHTGLDSFKFFNVDTNSCARFSGVTATVEQYTDITLCNKGSDIEVTGISGCLYLNGYSLKIKTIFLTAPAIFLLDGEFFPAALRIVTEEGPIFSVLFVLACTSETTDIPVLASLLRSLLAVQTLGSSSTLDVALPSASVLNPLLNAVLAQEAFLEAYVGDQLYYVTETPLELDLQLWKALKTAVKVVA